jgi:hypothetical protein
VHNLPRGFQPTHPWHGDIHRDDIGLQSLGQAHGVLAIVCGPNNMQITSILEEGDQQLAHRK